MTTTMTADRLTSRRPNPIAYRSANAPIAKTGADHIDVVRLSLLPKMSPVSARPKGISPGTNRQIDAGIPALLRGVAYVVG